MYTVDVFWILKHPRPKENVKNNHVEFNRRLHGSITGHSETTTFATFFVLFRAQEICLTAANANGALPVPFAGFKLGQFASSRQGKKGKGKKGGERKARKGTQGS